MVTPQLLARLDELAADVGRLRRRFAANEHAWTGAYVCDRLADHVEWLDVMLSPSAAELAADAYPGDDQAIVAAIDHVDARTATIRQLLRDDTREERRRAEIAARVEPLTTAEELA